MEAGRVNLFPDRPLAQIHLAGSSPASDCRAGVVLMVGSAIRDARVSYHPDWVYVHFLLEVRSQCYNIVESM